MAIARSILKGISSFFFLTFLLATVLLFGLVKFTQYENLKPIVISIISKQVNETQFSQLYPYIELYCKSRNETVKLNFTVGEVEISCQEIFGKAPNQVVEIFASKVFDKIYYKKYECEFIDCLKGARKKEDYVIFVSEKSNLFFKEILPYSLFATIFFLIIFLIACESWYVRTKNLGITLLMLGLPYFIFRFTLSELLQKFLPLEMVEVVTPTIDVIFSYFHQSFFLILSISIVLLFIALAIKLKKGK
jgi:hypothetical protein